SGSPSGPRHRARSRAGAAARPRSRSRCRRSGRRGTARRDRDEPARAAAADPRSRRAPRAARPHPPRGVSARLEVVEALAVLEWAEAVREAVVAVGEELALRHQAREGAVDEVLAGAQVVEDRRAEDEEAAVDAQVRRLHVADADDVALRIVLDEVEAPVR